MPEERTQTSSSQGKKIVHFKKQQPSQLGLHRLQVFVERLVNLCFIQWGFLCPLKHVLIHVAIIPAKHRSKMNIMEVEGVYQCYCIGTNYSQEFLHTLVHLSNLGVCQNTRLQKNPLHSY